MAADETASTLNIRYDPFRTWINQRVNALARGGASPTGTRIQGYLSEGSEATRTLAQLRHAVGKPIGSQPDILEWTLEGLPENNILQHGDAPTSREQAAYAALTLFAVHQQSVRDASMNQPGVSFGTAVGRLSRGDPNSAGITRRFTAIQTTGQWSDIVRQSRRLIQLLRTSRVPLDYGLFAQDLVLLQGTEKQANSVRFRWGRDFARVRQNATAEDANQDAPIKPTKKGQS